MTRRSLIIEPQDTVAVLLEDAFKGDSIEGPGGTITLLDDIEFAHKAALVDHGAREPVIKYGHEIGYALDAIKRGTWIHNHNMGCDRGR
ncbi:MAG: UxaA family hydrolase [Treponema sp.]|nr:UxaA family hydrolase [Treponema sp.]